MERVGAEPLVVVSGALSRRQRERLDAIARSRARSRSAELRRALNVYLVLADLDESERTKEAKT